MKKRYRSSGWARSFTRSVAAMARLTRTTGTRALARTLKPAPLPAPARRPPQRRGGAAAGLWTPGLVLGTAGARRFRLYRPPGVAPGERLPLMVMLHGCGQDAEGFAASTRMNRLAQRGRFLVLYPEQDRLANPQGCWNWFDTRNGRAFGEADLILKAIDQVCLLHPVDRARVAIAGLSAGASMAALLVTREPGRFKAVVMHSGVAPGTAHSPLTALSAMRGRRTTPALRADNWPALLVIHGDADTVVSPHNARVAAGVWARAVGALPGPVRTVQRGQRYPMTVTDFKHQGHTRVSLVTVAGLAHAWSGGAAKKPFGDGQGPDASRLAWAFVARQFNAR